MTYVLPEKGPRAVRSRGGGRCPGCPPSSEPRSQPPPFAASAPRPGPVSVRWRGTNRRPTPATSHQISFTSNPKSQVITGIHKQPQPITTNHKQQQWIVNLTGTSSASVPGGGGWRIAITRLENFVRSSAVTWHVHSVKRRPISAGVSCAKSHAICLRRSSKRQKRSVESQATGGWLVN